MYQTRFVMQMPVDVVGQVATYVARVISETGNQPTAVNMNVPEGDSVASVTIVYRTPTSLESDRIITLYRAIDQRVQVERVHLLDPQQFAAVALAGTENNSLRQHICSHVQVLCNKGVGSKGILEYLEECEAVVVELREFVQSVRAPV